MSKISKSPTREECDELFRIHKDFLTWANDKRDSLTLGFSVLVCECPSPRDVAEIIYGRSDSRTIAMLRRLTRAELVERYVSVNWDREAV